MQLLKILKATLKNTRQFTEDQEDYLKQVITQLEEGGLPKQTAKEALKALNALKQDLMNPFNVLATLHNHIPERLLGSHYAEDEMLDDQLERGDVEKRFTKDERGTRCRIEGLASNGRPIHVICGLKGDSNLVIITTYALTKES